MAVAPDAPYPLLTAVMQVARRALPTAARGRLRRWMFRWLDLSWRTPAGVRLEVASYIEWVIYNEIFVSGEYDAAIDRALSAAAADAPLHVVDLGAHVGFFTLRLVDRARRRDPARRLAVTAVEASGAHREQFRTRVLDRNALHDQVRLVAGLLGARSGSATYFEDAASARTGSRGVELACVDLSPLLAPVSRIDLLKCDIEGSEQAVLEGYPDVFRKVQVAVFEMHANLCDVERCKSLLAAYGLTNQVTIRAGAPYFTYCAWR